MLEKTGTEVTSTVNGKRQKFIELAENRTKNAIKAI